MNHTYVLNHLVDKFGLKRYCEVGIQTTGQNFDKIKAPFKIGCDPAVAQSITKNRMVFSMESDKFFDMWSRRPGEFISTVEENKIDLYFLDGLHTEEQIKKDFENALALLADGGFIVIHDTCPDEEECTYVPRVSKKWFGSVYKFALNLGNNYQGINFLTLDIDCGITIVWKFKNEVTTGSYFKQTWDNYVAMKRILLQIGTIEEFDSLMTIKKP
jgi:hypothetical protein